LDSKNLNGLTWEVGKFSHWQNFKYFLDFEPKFRLTFFYFEDLLQWQIFRNILLQILYHKIKFLQELYAPYESLNLTI